jgi:hypothetical protein
MVIVPTAALAVAVNETVTVQAGLQGLLLKVAVTPVGRLETVSVTGVVVPLSRVTIIEDDGLFEPWTTVKLVGEGVERLKSKGGGAATTRESVAV